ncbi:MAG TPA: hypothetical protein PLK85_05855 [Alphaproteobacteria bacterium]|nr:hypothetical protein [Alphaproteobacteria bacterium]
MTVSQQLKKLNLVSGGKTLEIFDKYYSDIFDVSYNSESELIKMLWARYPATSNSLNGKVFEGLLAVIFYRSGIRPLYIQANFTFVANVNFDFVAFSQEHGPIAISVKTSLRERYKQADLEGTAFKQVHRGAKSYLITLDDAAAQTANEKIQRNLILGIDEVIVATHKNFDEMIKFLKTLHYVIPEKVEIVQSTNIVQ